ncbi:MAG: hypothetical protein HKN29_03720, partial [Rhodothermales bacterium]|nr:hypothetical protein [Rhodothermales bacterium]
AMVRAMGLDNVDVWNGRAEAWDGASSYFVSRATAPLRKLWQWSRRAGVWAGEGVATPARTEGSEAAQSEQEKGQQAGHETSDSPRGAVPEARLTWERGLICLKGGDLAREIRQVKREVVEWPLVDVIDGERYAGKYIIQIKP